MLVRWVVRALVILAAAYLVRGFYVGSFMGALVLVLILGLLNILVRPVLFLLTLPINILSLGLFTFVINAIVLELAAWLVPEVVVVSSFFTALLASVVISVLSTAVEMMAKK